MLFACFGALLPLSTPMLVLSLSMIILRLCGPLQPMLVCTSGLLLSTALLLLSENLISEAQNSLMENNVVTGLLKLHCRPAKFFPFSIIFIWRVSMTSQGAPSTNRLFHQSRSSESAHKTRSFSRLPVFQHPIYYGCLPSQHLKLPLLQSQGRWISLRL